MPLNANALVQIEPVLIFLNKYAVTTLTGKALTDSGNHKNYTFPNKYIVEGTVTIKESGSAINDVKLINYEAGTVEFNNTHGALTADYKYLAFDYSDRYNLERLINSVSTEVENYTGRKLVSTEYVDEEYSGNNRQRLVLNQYPVTSLDSVKWEDSLMDSDEYSINSQDAEKGFIYRENGWQGNYLYSGLVGEPVASSRSYKVTYTAGYDQIPSDIQEVVIEMISEKLMLQKSQASGLKSIDQGELRYVFGDDGGYNSAGMPLKYAKVLDKYKREWL
jgi:hypothetical protein